VRPLTRWGRRGVTAPRRRYLARKERQRAEHERQRIEQARTERLHAAQTSTGLLLDVGTSTEYLTPGWLGLDINPDDEALRLDASEPWPLPDGCARAVRAEHMIEHLSWDEAALCIREIARVLEPGGLCRICTPDLEGIARSYLERDPRVLDVHRKHGYVAPTWSHVPNNYLRMWGHSFVFDFDSLRFLLEDAGFEQVERTRFNRSRHDLLNGTDTHDMGELEPLVVCVDAVKETPLRARH
jgi:predicted SAM-dependent methyltransferase